MFWVDQNDKDRGDWEDSRNVAKSLKLKKIGQQKLFYQIKFELADVLYQSMRYGRVSANQPSGIFDKEVNDRESLTGILRHYYPRPDVHQIEQVALSDRLPNHEWNGKWEQPEVNGKVG